MTAAASPGIPLSLSLDLDNLWAYMKIHGDAGWDQFPSYLDRLAEVVIPRLRRHGLKITVFMVGQDAALEKNGDALAALAGDGREVGNHSFHHESWLHLYSREEIDKELESAEEAIERVTGKRPRGFRGPGFSCSQATLEVLARRGYTYDASTLPTFLGPAARAYYFWRSRGLSREERAKRSRLFGTFREGFRPLRPYAWDTAAGRVLEMPVTTLPFARTPFHLSYVLYLAGYARFLGLAYLKFGLRLCRLLGLEPSYLLHPLDFLGGDDVTQLSFFPGMQLPTSFKLDLFDQVMTWMARRFSIQPMGEHADRLLEHGDLSVRKSPSEGARAGVA